MIWLTWRQFRAQAAAVFAVVSAAAIVLAVTGPRLVDLAKINANVYDQLTKADRNLFAAGVIVLAVAPAIIGAFWGAPMVARELEAGTHRLVWNQSVTRTRWLAAKLGVTALAASLAVGALTLAVSWWADPIDGALSNTRGSLPSRLTPVTFAMRGIAPIGYVVFALVLGVALGIVLRRPLPAMALTLAIFIFVQITMPLWVRPHLAPAVHKSITISRATLDGLNINGPGGPVHIFVKAGDPGAWVLTNETVNSAGQRAAALPSWFSACLPPPPGAAPSGTVTKTPVGATSLESCYTRLTAEGYRQRVIYQPADHFWRLQWAETGLFLALSGLLAWFCFWWIRRLS